MIHTLSPKATQALLEQGGVDVVDVREPHEYAYGFIAGSRNVPLGELNKDKLPRDKVLFVCARGVRSEKAAKLAEQVGLTEIYHLEGGTAAWTSEQLPLAMPPQPDGPPRPSAAESAPAGESCAMPEPGLDAAVGVNMRALREQKGLSLDQLARMTGMSRTLLGQIELGKTPASVSTVWRIAQAFDVHFSAMLSTPQPLTNQVLRGTGAKRLVSPDGRYSSRALYPLSEKPDAEFYELFLSAHSREDAQAHKPGTRENLIVTAGRLELKVGAQSFELEKGDAIVFTADVAHSYINPGSTDCWMYLVMTYANRAP
jgi:rhodanese-related sulfurtransferase/transcriptional regulator with XRE-family HTH domain